MKIIHWAMAWSSVCILTGCTLLELESPAPPPAPVETLIVQREGVLQPRRSIAELLVERLAICSFENGGRPATVRETQARSESAGVDVVDEAKLDELLIASCKPARTPGVLNQLLVELTSAGTWPEEYAAFFDLLIAGQRAYAAVEKVYLDLKEEHEKAIQGLSEIEAQIELQSLNSVGVKPPL